MKKLSQERVAEILRLRERGFAYREIIAKTGACKSAVQKYCSRLRPELRNVAMDRAPQEIIDQITRLRRLGYSVPRIVKTLGVSYALAVKTCQRYCPGLKNVGHKKIDHKKYEIVERHYKEGYTCKELAEMMGVHSCTVQRYLKKKGVRMPLTRFRKECRL